MGIAEKLDIFLITYNRAPYLKKTLEQLFSAESPIKNFPITIIDNNSTEIFKNYENIKYEIDLETNKNKEITNKKACEILGMTRGTFFRYLKELDI